MAGTKHKVAMATITPWSLSIMPAHYSLVERPSAPDGEHRGAHPPAPLTDDGQVVFTVNFTNDANNAGSVYWFQTGSGANDPNVRSLVWIASGSNPHTGCRLRWSEDFAMFWSSTAPGLYELTSFEFLDCTLTSDNQATLEYSQDGFSFSGQGNAPATGMTIIENATIPGNTATVGIGMAGAGVFSTAAQANLTITFCPVPAYWIAFSLTAMEPGAALNLPVQMAQAIVFPNNAYTCNATLNVDQSWTISYGP